ncbi:MAG TPA: hypothetical protein VFN27_16920 [Xanthobacteraceae bacterium]|nr:hypothetical protein [Xanthobacteraceae bacterium]
MGLRTYVSAFDNVSIGTAVQDIFSIKSGAANGVQIHYIELNAAGVTSPAEIRLRFKKLTGTLTAGSAGTAPAMNALDDSETKTATATVRANDTTQASGTTSTSLMFWQWNVLLPFQYLPAPEDRPQILAAEQLLLDLPAAIATATTVSGIIKWQEIP